MSAIETNQLIHDKAAFVVGIYDKHMQYMFRTAMRVSGNEDEARDLVDTAVANLFVGDLSNFPKEDNQQQRYLSGAVKNAKLAEVRLMKGLTRSAIKRGIRVESLYSDHPYSYAAPDSTEGTALAAIEIEEIVLAATASSDSIARNRARVELLRGIGFSQREIAQIETIPEGTVKSRMFRAKGNQTNKETDDSKPSQSESNELLHMLSKVEQRVMALRLGVADGTVYGCSEIAGKLGITEKDVKVLESHSLIKIRNSSLGQSMHINCEENHGDTQRNSEQKELMGNEQKKDPDVVTLPLRCSEVLQLMSQGLQNKQIAKIMRISDGTLTVYQNSMYKFFNVHSQEAALFLAKKQGVIDLSEEIAGFSLDHFNLLTPRERDVIAFVYENIMGDNSNNSLARHLGVGVDSVARYMPNIQKKLQVANRFQAILFYEVYNSEKPIHKTTTNDKRDEINDNHNTIGHNFYKHHSEVAA